MTRSKTWGRRKRRLRRMAGVVLGVVVGTLLFGWWRSRDSAATRVPGEDLPEITRRLASDLPAGAPLPRFADVTEEAGLAGFRTFLGDRTSQLPEDMGAGVAWGDYDNDGDDDLLVVGAGGPMPADPASWAETVLYTNNGDATFQRNDAFPQSRILGMGAAWGDIDGDGWLDLALTGFDTILLMRNRSGRFERDDSLTLPGYWAGASWGDFDNDGDLDLYVCGYVQYRATAADRQRSSEQFGEAVPYTLNPASFDPERNLLFENDGAGGFKEVGLLRGVSNPTGRSLSALWHDFDDDGRLDLYVANDISDNALFLNRGETFEDAGLAAWVADYRGAMGLAVGDWNRDGDDDLFITHWIAQENALYDSRLTNAAGGQGGGNRLLTFSDIASPMGLGQIALQAVGWGTEFADLDQDGWLDLIVANGSTFETDEEPRRLVPQPAFVLWNEQGRRFHDLAPLSEVLAQPRVGRGLALSDYDLDGDLDIALATLDDGVRLLRNDMATGHWLAIDLRRPGKGSGLGQGSTVVVVLDSGVELRRSVSSASYLSQSSATLHFGLGTASGIDRVDVHWLGGAVASYRDLEADARWELIEGEAAPNRVSTLDRRERVVAFWEVQRAAMDALRREHDPEKAIGLFRRALELDPRHEDSRYYLANLLAARGDVDAALTQLDAVIEHNPMSHRALKQKGLLLAMHANSRKDLDAAEGFLQQAHELNPEETGSLLALGEMALLRGDLETADQRLAQACRSNPRAVGGFFLRGYIAWRRGDAEQAVALLQTAHQARGEDWKPEGAAAEGDAARVTFREETPLSRFWQQWDGDAEPREAFRSLREYLEARRTA